MCEQCDRLKTDTAALESLVDRYGLSMILRTLAEIASEKAEHIRSNWQDAGAAREWDRAAAKVDCVAGKVDV